MLTYPPPRRVLVIEDDSPSQQLIAYLLGAFGYTVLLAGSGEEGLEIARRERPDLIVCDVLLPRLDGIGVLHALKADPATRSIPVIAMTILTSAEDRARLLAAGFDGYIPKPLIAESLEGQIAGCLQSKPDCSRGAGAGRDA